MAGLAFPYKVFLGKAKFGPVGFPGAVRGEDEEVG
jgi:hypothetical protein